MSRSLMTLALLCSLGLAPTAIAGDSGLELFEQRIMPIFRSSEPSSCIQCHLASVDLKDYIRPSHEETFLSLRDQGLIDLADPSQSKILKLIGMGDKDRDLQAKRIHAKNREAELEAFGAWIAACCSDRALVERPPLDPQSVAKPKAELGVIRHARKDRILDSFVRNVWSQRMRCFPCHTPEEIDADNPAHEKPRERYDDFVKKYGGRMDLFKATAEETMNSMIRSSRRRSAKHLPMLNLDEPTQSLLVLKPTSKLPKPISKGVFEEPSSLAPVSHMGGLKMHVDDVSYKAVVAWIKDLASVSSGQYATTHELPEDNWFPTRQVLRVKEVPESWPVMSRVQLFVHLVPEGTKECDSNPIAFTQGMVTPRRFVNGNLIMLTSGEAGSESQEGPGSPSNETGEYGTGGTAVPDGVGRSELDPDAARIPAGTYVVKVYLDSQQAIERDPTAFLGGDDFQGQVQMTTEWKEGFKNAQVVSAQDLSR